MTEFKLPELGENIHEGDLVRLMVSPGATVSEGQSVMELETDKAVVEVPSSVSGVVKDVRVKEGEKIKVGQVIFTVDNGAGGAKVASPAKPLAAPSPSPSAPKPASPVSNVQAATQVSPPTVPTAPSEAAEVTEFRLPELGENIHQGDLVRLMVSPGATISEGQPVMELETDKAVVEVPSSVSGIVKDVLVNQGEQIKVGQVVFTLQAGATSQAHAQHAPHADESHEHERSTFQAAMQSEGKTEEEALPGWNIGDRSRRLPTCDAWRANWGLIFTMCPEAALADASARTMSRLSRKRFSPRAPERARPLI